MINDVIYSIDLLVSVFGFLSCIYILMNNAVNKRTAKCVISTCLAGFIWFIFLYSSILQTHQAMIFEILLKCSVFYITLAWINNNCEQCLRNHVIRKIKIN